MLHFLLALFSMERSINFIKNIFYNEIYVYIRCDIEWEVSEGNTNRRHILKYFLYGVHEISKTEAHFK